MGGTRRPTPNPNYDFSFPVELAGRPGLQINWNRGDDPNMVAIQFCDDDGIPRDQLGDVAVFVQNVMASLHVVSTFGFFFPPPSRLLPASLSRKNPPDLSDGPPFWSPNQNAPVARRRPGSR